MFPYLAKIGTFLIPTHAVTHFLAYTIGVVGFFHWSKKMGFDLQKLANFLFITIITALVGARLSAVLMLTSAEKFRWFLEHPVEIAKFWKGGLSLYGEVAGSVLFGGWYVLRKNMPVWKISDLTVPWVAFGFFIQSFGCLGAGCHPGSPTDLPWGIVYNHPLFKGPKGIPLHPFALYHAAMILPFFVFAWARISTYYFPRPHLLSRVYGKIDQIYPGARFEGDLLLIAGLSYGMARFVLEFTRHPDFHIWYPGFPLPQVQIACVALFLFSLGAYLILWIYRTCEREHIPYPGWIRLLLKIFDGMEWFAKRFPWPVREADGKGQRAKNQEK